MTDLLRYGFDIANLGILYLFLCIASLRLFESSASFLAWCFQSVKAIAEIKHISRQIVCFVIGFSFKEFF